MFKNVLIVSSLIATISAHTAEVDQFTRSNEELFDSAEIINSKANEYLRDAIANLNSTNNNCDETKLYKELRKSFGNHINGDFTKFVIKDSSVPKRHIPITESIYKNWNSWNGFILGSPIYRKSGIALSDLVRVGDNVVGTDKFEHLFGRGFKYFSSYYLKNKSINDTINTGITQEKLIYGGLNIETGVFSYADLSANFNGMRFWNSILNKRADVLSPEHRLPTIIECRQTQWVQVNQLDFRNYFDKTMNESFNCSKFSVKESVKKYTKELELLNAKCGLDQALLNEFVLKYGSFTKYIINFNGNDKVKYFGEFSEK
jgi:hypothetical protein